MQLQKAIQKTLRALRPTLLLMCGVAQVGWGTVLADIAPNPLSGGTNLATKGAKKTSVAMVDEVVKLRVSRESCHVDVVFTMTNKGDLAETMPVGFPFFYADELKDFKATIDDAKIAITDEKGHMTPGSLDQPSGYTPYWKLWKTTFQPGKPVKIAVSYWTKLSSVSWGSNADLQNVPYLLTTLVPDNERAALEKQLDVRRVTYILRTGSRWSGPIGRCQIEASFDGMSTDNLTLYGPDFEKDRATITAGKITWDLKDYEPKRDVEFKISPFITRKATLQLLERLQRQNHRNAVLTAVQVEYLNAAGRQPLAEVRLLEFLNSCHDKVVIWEPRGKQDLSLEESVNVFKMVQQIVGTRSFPPPKKGEDPLWTRGLLPSFRPRNPEAFVPAFERIAKSVKKQWKQVPEADPYYANEVEAILAWCQRHAN